MASKQYFNPETNVVFKSTGGDVTFTPQNVANAAGRISAQLDRGAGAKPGFYRWYALTKAAAALAVGNQLRIYLNQSHGSAAGEVTGNQATTDGAFASEDKLRNMGAPIGVVNADSTTNGEIQIATGVCFIYSRYVQVVWWNALGQALTNVAADHVFILTPIPPEQQ